VAQLPVQPTLRRLRQFAVHPNRELGQNFLIDSNILGVIAAGAQLEKDDVILEIGGGLGVLSEYLAERLQEGGHVHVVEIDRRLEQALLDATARFSNLTVHWGDALRIDLRGLDPAPSKVVANLPYGVATGVLLRTIAELDTVGSWVAMVQREAGERLASAPGNSTYGAPSVIAQVACEVRVLRGISRSVFYPVPNVDSVLIHLRRRGAGCTPGLRGLINGAFAHRRKTLIRSLLLAGQAHGHSPAALGEALAALGHPAQVRAERLSPEDFRALAGILGV
jgi:16S rRNA (adenine1518-N6/adenine1519-N6)-dimethyltransferase